MKKTLSVIVPIYYGIQFIPSILEMLISNYLRAVKTFPLFLEIIFVNDSPEIEIAINEFTSSKIKKYHIDIKIICHERNFGIHISRIHGLNVASGDFIFFLDQDDVISDNFILHQLSKIENADAVICNGYEHGIPIVDNVKVFCNTLIERKNIIFIGKQIFPGQVILRKNSIPLEWINNIITTNCSDDLYLWCLMLSQGKKFAFLSEKLYCHVATGENASSQLKKKLKSNKEVYRILLKHDIIKKKEYDFIIQKENSFCGKDILLERDMKYSAYTWILDAWMICREKGYSISNWIKDREFTHIVIYGYGILGKHLFWELHQSPELTLYVMDQNNQLDIEGSVVKIGENIPLLDLLIITPTYQYKNIRMNLQQYYDCEIVSMETIISTLPLLD